MDINYAKDFQVKEMLMLKNAYVNPSAKKPTRQLAEQPKQ